MDYVIRDPVHEGQNPADRSTTHHELNEIAGHRYFSHTPDPNDPNPFTPIENNKVLTDPWSIGENLAEGEGVFGKMRAIFGAWRHSASHWRNIKNERFTNVGFAMKHLKRIVMDVDLENGSKLKDVVMRNVTLIVTEFSNQ